ncbi:unnamed protein product [Rodentolepis nana]|uniref:Amyloid protein-binding protein 2 n=1 Tax=Rodentolepis nana TaxID=102285 RepID=A0A3P7T688_RODNA|nr:unnamed protein product [Rodentolepis nana]
MSSLAPDTFPVGNVSHHSADSDERTDGICTAFAFAELGSFYYAICNYQLACRLANLALRRISTKSSSPRVVIQVLRLVCRICVIQRKFVLGMKIIQLVAQFTRETLGSHNILYANLLLDHACLFLNTDNTSRALELYRVGLSIMLDCLPGLSMTTALALEDIAYAFYVHEYNTGNFDLARLFAEKAVGTIKHLGDQCCMQYGSAIRVKALILEEIALSEPHPQRRESRLLIAKDMHLLSLHICEETFGVWNVQTAKHIGNLGRVFQALKRSTLAEKMHLKAISIKERFLGPNDYEVGLSVGHLACLYNYHMREYKKAEALYLRSAQISLDAFGPGYSGLEYDYKGLQSVYRKMKNMEKMREYIRIFDEWKEYRQHHEHIFSSTVVEDAMEGYLEPSSSFVTHLDTIWREFRSIFGTLLGGNGVEDTSQEKEGEGSGSR